MQDICDDLLAHRAEVVRIFDELASKRPWVALPQENKIDDLPELIVGLVEASLCNPFEVESHRLKIKAAIKHGRSRFEDGFPENLILEEYDLLHAAIWRYVREKFNDSERATDAMLRIDAAITLATQGSLYGYHTARSEARDGVSEPEAVDNLEEVVERLSRSSRLLRGEEQ